MGLEVWDPRTGEVVRRLPGDFPIAAHGDLLAWCPRRCERLHVTNVATGTEVEVRPPAGASAFEAYGGAFSPDGRLIAVPVRTGHAHSAPAHLALVDVRSGAATQVDGTEMRGAYTFVDWSPSGESVFMSGGERFGQRTIVEYQLGDAGAARLRVEVGDFYDMVAG